MSLVQLREVGAYAVEGVDNKLRRAAKGSLEDGGLVLCRMVGLAPLRPAPVVPRRAGRSQVPAQRERVSSLAAQQCIPLLVRRMRPMQRALAAGVGRVQRELWNWRRAGGGSYTAGVGGGSPGPQKARSALMM